MAVGTAEVAYNQDNTSPDADDMGNDPNGVSTPPNNRSNPQQSNEEKKLIEYNPRSMGYCYIILASLVNFCAISSVPGEQRATFWYLSIAFGVLTFCISSLLLFLDWSQQWIKHLPDLKKARNGYVEGFILFFMVVWWIVGVVYITRPGGIAYLASNIWYSAWLSLFACVYTLNEWSGDKDLLSIEEITSLSPTLKFWWLLFFTAFIVFGSCIDIIIRYSQERNDIQDASFGLALGLVSMVISFTMILVHYDFLTACECEEGGWTELFASFFLILVWIIGLSILTSDGGIAATMSGNQCISHPAIAGSMNCTMVVFDRVIPCDEIPKQVPGSNLYYACWFCFLFSMAIAFKWKAAQALKFAQAQAERQQQKELLEQQLGSDYGESDDDDDGN